MKDKNSQSHSLYVITHKPIKNVFPNDRKIMFVGAKNKNIPNGYYSDYEQNKDNISEKNSSFCELTGLYYMIKNDNSDILGLEHYRRYFATRKFYLFSFPFLKIKKIKEILSNYDIIVPKKSIFNTSLKKHYELYHIASDLNEVRTAINNLYPDYLNIYDEVMNKNFAYTCNMLIGKNEIIKGYANWLFDILFEVEKHISLEGRDAMQKRVFGFLSERLLIVYLTKNSNIKIFESENNFISGSPFKSFFYSVKNKITKLLHHK